MRSKDLDYNKVNKLQGDKEDNFSVMLTTQRSRFVEYVKKKLSSMRFRKLISSQK